MAGGGSYYAAAAGDDDDDPLLLRRYDAARGIAISASACALLLGSAGALGAVDPGCPFLGWGPSAGLTFAGVRIDTWGRWAGVMAYSAASQVAQSLVYASLSPWVSNVVRDHKTPIPRGALTYLTIQGVVGVYRLFQWLVGVMDTFVWITCQLQFILPALVSDVAVGVFTTHSYVRNKGAAREEEEEGGEGRGC